MLQGGDNIQSVTKHLYPFLRVVAYACTHLHNLSTYQQSNDGDEESRSGDSYGRSEVKTEVAPRRRKKKKDDDDFVFLDRRSIALDLDDAKKFPEARRLMRQETFPDPHKEPGYTHSSEDDHALSERTQELSLSTTSKQTSSQTSSKVCE